MKISPTISLQEMADILREGILARFPNVDGVDQITIQSYDQPRITIDYNNGPMVESTQFRHRA